MQNIALFATIILTVLRIEAIEFIGGEINGELKPGEYIVTETIHVTKNGKLSISSGVRLYFEQFSGIKVSGEIYCNGTADQPILFTSKREFLDPQKNALAEPFDWNGIEIGNEATCASLNNTHISSCTFGIQIKSTETKISIQNVVFTNIGYASLTRKAKLVEVQQNIPFNISWNINLPDFSTVHLGNNVNSPNPEKTKKIKLAFQLGTSAITLCGGVVLVCSSILASKNRESYLSQNNPNDADHYRKAFNKSRNWQYAGGTLLTIGSIGAGIIFIF